MEIEITEEEWEETYKPIQNHLDADASWGGAMFETYGEEAKTDRACITAGHTLTAVGCLK